MPTSSLCLQLWTPNWECLQAARLDSVPWHCTLSNQIGMLCVPDPVIDDPIAIAPVLLANKEVKIKPKTRKWNLNYSGTSGIRPPGIRPSPLSEHVLLNKKCFIMLKLTSNIRLPALYDLFFSDIGGSYTRGSIVHVFFW